MRDESNNVQWGSGGGDDGSGSPKLSAERLAEIEKKVAEEKPASAANRQLVAPNAAEIKKMRDLTIPIIAVRTQAKPAAMSP